MDDQELMAAAMSDEAPATPEPEQAQAEPESQPRDEHGRFAPKVAAEAEPQAQPEPVQAEQPRPDAEATVPSWRLRELREEREAAAARAKAAEERAAQVEAQWRQFLASQPKPEAKPAPDMYAEPEAWQQHLTQQNQSAIERVRFELSEDQARDKYGDEKVNAALQWLQQNLDPTVKARVASARNPYREMVTLYDERQTLSQIGGDLNAYRSKVLDEALNDPAFMQKVADKLRGVQPTNGNAPVVQIPPSLNKAPGSQINEARASMSDADLYHFATR